MHKKKAPIKLHVFVMFLLFCKSIRNHTKKLFLCKVTHNILNEKNITFLRVGLASMGMLIQAVVSLLN